MIVADTSVLVKLVAPEPGADVARRLRQDEIMAPSVWVAETANVFWRKVRTNEMKPAHARQFLEILLGTIRSLGSDALADEALSLALDIDHPVYDCFFLAAAIRENTRVVTDDTRFAAAVRRHGKWSSHLRLLGEM